MSRVGKKPIQIPEGVEIKIDNSLVSVKGPKGELKREIPEGVLVEQKTCLPAGRNKEIIVSIKQETKKSKSFWGLIRTLIYNMIEGVTNGHEKKLEIQGVGYKANVEDGDLVLMVGFSHPVKIRKPEGIIFSVEKNIITISGQDKELVGQTADKIRKIRKPEPYKGKGIRYVGEQVRGKVGKRAVGTE